MSSEIVPPNEYSVNEQFLITCRVDPEYKDKLIKFIFEYDRIYHFGRGDELFNEYTTIILESLLHDKPGFQNYIDRYLKKND